MTRSLHIVHEKNGSRRVHRKSKSLRRSIYAGDRHIKTGTDKEGNQTQIQARLGDKVNNNWFFNRTPPHPQGIDEKSAAKRRIRELIKDIDAHDEGGNLDHGDTEDSGSESERGDGMCARAWRCVFFVFFLCVCVCVCVHVCMYDAVCVCVFVCVHIQL